MKKIIIALVAILFITNAYSQSNLSNFVFCSDVHYGKTKYQFRGKDSATAYEVNAAMVEQINKMAKITLPAGNGVGENTPVKGIEAVIITGDIANREEFDKEDKKQIQPASKSWEEFKEQYVNGLTLKNKNGQPSPLLLTVGNHDVSNAIGFHKKMFPETDATAFIGIYNLMMKPQKPVTKETFNYDTQKVHYSRYMSGVHFQFVNLWPDTEERMWMEKDLDTVSVTTPVFIFTHSSPDVEARFFVNPNGDHSINKIDKFENLLSEPFKDGNDTKDTAKIEQAAFVDFLLKYKNIKVYFHGHSNHNEFYAWADLDHRILLPCIRVDSPMKGSLSSKDETKLSYQLISYDSDKKLLTVRECLWNAEPTNKAQSIQWGQSITMSVK